MAQSTSGKVRVHHPASIQEYWGTPVITEAFRGAGPLVTTVYEWLIYGHHSMAVAAQMGMA